MNRKLLIILVLSLLTLFSCQNDNLVMENTEKFPLDKNECELSEQEVIQVLNSFIQKTSYSGMQTRSNTVSVSKYEKKYYKSEKPSTRTGNNAEVAIYNFELQSGKDNGFALVCADKSNPAVIAYSLKGTIEDIEKGDNEFLKNYVANLPAAIVEILSRREYIPNLNLRYPAGFPTVDVPNVSYSWESDSTKEKIAYLQRNISWEQGAPYNNKMPVDPATNKRCLVGCSNIATLNIMAYHNYPANYDWTNLKQYEVVIPGWQPQSVIDNAAQLCLDVYTIVGSKGSSSATSTTPNQAYAGFYDLGFLCNPIHAYNLDSIRSSINNLRPIWMCGQDSTSSSAHAFVVRGYWEIINKNEANAFSVSLGFNWGWMGGYGDGWYLVEYEGFDLSFIGLRPKIFGNDGPAISKKNYNKNMRIITQIRPNRNL